MSTAKIMQSFSLLPWSVRQTMLLRPSSIHHFHHFSISPRARAQENPLRILQSNNSQLCRFASTGAPQQNAKAQAEAQQTFVAAPGETSGPLLERLPNRELPSLERTNPHVWLYTLPIFLLLCTAFSLSIFNYQKSSSSTVSSILYALRTSSACRELLGDEIYFRSRIPWISGELNPLQGRIDVSFWVKGKKQDGKVRFVSTRRGRGATFETREWSLEVTGPDGKTQTVQLLDKDVEGRQAIEDTVGEIEQQGVLTG